MPKEPGVGPMITDDLSNGCKPHAPLAYVPDRVVMLKETSSDKVKPIKGIYEGLTDRRVVCERPNTQFAAWDRQIERDS